jgi:NAD(P)H-quinone oxidoreductase subunit 6
MIPTPVHALFFFLFAALAVAGGCVVAFARNIVHSGFALLATFVGIAGLYAFLSADFLAIVQVMIYVGGVLILILFALMLTARIDDARVSNPTIGKLPAAFLLLAFGGLLVFASVKEFGGVTELPAGDPTTAGIGDALLSRFVMPFEVISVLLLAALLGAVTIAGGRLRKPDSEKEPS